MGALDKYVIGNNFLDYILSCNIGALWVWMIHRVKKSLKGNSGENIYIGLVGMPKHQNEKNSSRESQVPT